MKRGATVFRTLTIAALGIWIAAAGTVVAEAAPKGSAYRKQVDRNFAGWVKDLKIEALSKGISPKTFDAALKGVTLNWKLPDLIWPDLGDGQPATPKRRKKEKRQAEFDRPALYFPQKHINNLVKAGRKRLSQWSKTLAKVEKTYGVQKEVVLAIWGRETSYGRFPIPYYTVRALATQAYIGRRKTFFHAELLLALQILEEGHTSRRAMRSSWAGAMGHTQFLPSHFMKYAVDFTGDGRRDIWSTIPDALASTANFLSSQGWESGKTWGYEVKLPKGFDCTLEGEKNTRPIGDWVKLGITRTRDRKFRSDRLPENTRLVLPAGTRGPAFLALKNFGVLKKYNAADLYALFVGHLADRINSNRAFAGKWTRVAGFTRNEVRVIQRWLAAQGIEVGKVDGLIGGKTRVAVGQYQKSAGLTVNCYPNRALLKRAQAATASN